MAEQKTVEGAYAKIEAHEALCAERYSNIHSSMLDLKRAAERQDGLLIGIILSIAGTAIMVLLAIVLFKLGLSG